MCLRCRTVDNKGEHTKLFLLSWNLPIGSAMQDTRASLFVMLGCDAGNDEVEKAEASRILSAAAFGEREINGGVAERHDSPHCAALSPRFYYLARDACRQHLLL